jgi:hypothetical protein
MDLESQLRLDRDQVAVQAFLESARGSLVRRSDDEPGLYWVVLRPAGPPSSMFIVKVRWSVYPDRPPSVLFATEIGGPTGDARGWPAAPGYRPPVDICKPFTAEGQTVHPDWASGPHAWRAEGNPFLYVIETIQADLDRAAGARAA